MQQKFPIKSLAILGRQPELGFAELENLYGAEHISATADAALLDLPFDSINFNRLGSVLKLAEVIDVLDSIKWRDIERRLTILSAKMLHLEPEGKVTIGLSAYGFREKAANVQAIALAMKRNGKSVRPIRIIPNKEPVLNSAQVLHNGLTRTGAWEIIIYHYGHSTIIARTRHIQDIEAYAARDQRRPNRDARVGMLPPKLAQIIINLASPDTQSKVLSTESPAEPPAALATGDQRLATYLLDPFCGTGVLLQEALLMGIPSVGSDVDERMVRYSRENIDWLRQTTPRELPEVIIEQGDAAKHHWLQPISIVASEVFLGEPLHTPQPLPAVARVARPVDKLLRETLQNLRSQLAAHQQICLAVPAWRVAGSSQFYHLPLLDHLADLGYNRVSFVHTSAANLVYARDNQFVGRELVVLRTI